MNIEQTTVYAQAVLAKFAPKVEQTDKLQGQLLKHLKAYFKDNTFKVTPKMNYPTEKASDAFLAFAKKHKKEAKAAVTAGSTTGIKNGTWTGQDNNSYVVSITVSKVTDEAGLETEKTVYRWRRDGFKVTRKLPPFAASDENMQGTEQPGNDGQQYRSEERTQNRKDGSEKTGWRWIKVNASPPKGKKSPAESSSGLAVGTEREGLDGQPWIVKADKNEVNRWIRNGPAAAAVDDDDADDAEEADEADDSDDSDESESDSDEDEDEDEVQETVKVTRKPRAKTAKK